MQETLRVSLTATMAARVCEDREISLGGHIVPAGTPVITALGVALWDEKYFDQPNK